MQCVPHAYYAAVIGLAFLTAPFSAEALDLQQARKSGQICERATGYAAATGSADAEARALVDQVNALRKEEYARISAQNKQSVEVVAKLAAEQIRASGAPACP